MRLGADRHAFAERGHDLYETPPDAVRALLVNYRIPAGSPVWEPAAGRGAISRVLEAEGFPVIKSDLVAYDGADDGIEAPVDFLASRKPRAGLIVTNPPYRLADDFVRHGLALGCEVVVLLRLMAIEGRRRSDLMDTFCAEILAGVERLPFMHREGWQGPKQHNSGAPFAWFVFRPRPRTGAIALRRISWRSEP